MVVEHPIHEDGWAPKHLRTSNLTREALAVGVGRQTTVPSASVALADGVQVVANLALGEPGLPDVETLQAVEPLVVGMRRVETWCCPNRRAVRGNLAGEELLIAIRAEVDHPSVSGVDEGTVVRLD